MIEPSSSSSNELNIICQRLKARNIKSIAIIDDAYDPLEVTEVTEAQIETFWSELQGRGQQAMRDEFSRFTAAEFHREFTSSADMDGDVLLKLWEHHKSLEALQEPLTRLFTKFEKQQQLNRIVSRINERCVIGSESLLDIKTFGTGDDVVEQLEGSSIVFIDYYLGSGDDNQSKAKAIERANEITTKIYDRYAPDKLPLVILMSSLPEVKQQEEQFRKDKGWMIGLFYCVTKDDLEDAEKIGINLGTWIERLDQGTKVQRFVEAVDMSLKRGITDFVRSIKNLSLEDYAYVQNFSLAPNGQPLGEYMVWLFNAYLNRLAFENDAETAKARDVISGFNFDRLPLSQLMPSADLIEMYDSALFNKAIGDISHYPGLEEMREPELPLVDAKQDPPGDGSSLPILSVNEAVQETIAESASDTGVSEQPADDSPSSGDLVGSTTILAKPINPGLPYLRLGLVFVKDASHEIWMVLNPDCDLAYTPGGERQPTQVVALIAGELEEMKKIGSALAEPKTDLFKWNDGTYVIRWQVKRVSFVDYKNVVKEFEKSGYIPFALLRLPYALDVQRAYATHFTRIGMPAAPPIHHPVDVEILYRNEQKKVGEMLVRQPDLAFLTTVRDSAGEGKMKLTTRVTTHFGHQLKRAVANLRDEYGRQKDALGDEPAQKQRTDLGTKIRKVDDLLEKFDELFLSNPSPDLTGKADGKVISFFPKRDEIGICRNLHDKANFNSWEKYLLIVNLVDPDSVDISELAEADTPDA